MAGITFLTSGAGGTPAGSNGQVQFNDSGSFGANSGLSYNKVSYTLTVSDGITGNLSGSLTLSAAGAASGSGTTITSSGSATGLIPLTLSASAVNIMGGGMVVPAGVTGDLFGTACECRTAGRSRQYDIRRPDGEQQPLLPRPEALSCAIFLRNYRA